MILRINSLPGLPPWGKMKGGIKNVFGRIIVN
jgi:hypothetical protein